MSAFTGTGTLIRLALRCDRIKLPLWIVGVAGAMAANIPAVIMTYGNSLEKQLTYVATTAPSVVSRIFGGPINSPNIGEIVINETFLFTAVAMAFMSTLMIVRHTRQNEETGRAELIRSAVVSGPAPLIAALIVTVGTNILLAGLLSLIFIASDLPIAGSIGVSAALGAIGIIFAAIAAITAQLSESAHGANSLAAVAIGIVFLFRAIGDGLGSISRDGLAVTSAWPSWLSPIGWGQQIYSFSEGNWWIFGLFGILFAVLMSFAFFLSSHRDVGLGIFPARRGPAKAENSLLSPFGLAWRLQHGLIRGWSITVLVMGVTVGAVSKEFEKLFSENEEFLEYFGSLGKNNSINDILFSGMMVFMALAIGAYAVQALLRMRAEESTGHLEPVLSTSVNRTRWMLSHVTCVLIGVSVLILLLGLSASITYVLITDSAWSEVAHLTWAAIVQTPAILVLAGFTVAVFGFLPRKAVALSWTAFAFSMFIGQFGAILKLPGWVLDISPFTHTPAAPIEAVTALPIISLLSVSVVLVAAGFAYFRRRDITIS